MRNLIKIFVNILTTSRLVIAILLMKYFYKISSQYFLILITILFLTDFIDGKLARNFNVQTFYGSKMDTIGDKALSIGLTIILVKKIPIMILPLIGEIIISLINIIGELQRKKTKSIQIGRIKMWIISITIILSYAHYFDKISLPIVKISCLITFLSQILVIISYIKFLNTKKPNNKTNSKESLIYRLFSTKYYLENKE